MASTKRRAKPDPDAVRSTPARTRVIDAALRLFADLGISGTSLQMIADEIGVTKAAVYHQYRTKDEIVVAVAEVVLAGLEAALTRADAERTQARARQVLIAGMIDLAVQRRGWAGILQRDPIMLRCLEEHEPFRRVMERLNRTLIGGAIEPRARVRAAVIASSIAGAVIHPLVSDLDDESLQSLLLSEVRRFLPGGAR
jgi:AcrR family transcriptional regulator